VSAVLYITVMSELMTVGTQSDVISRGIGVSSILLYCESLGFKGIIFFRDVIIYIIPQILSNFNEMAKKERLNRVRFSRNIIQFAVSSFGIALISPVSVLKT
jgi:hypothetical protein